jgi:hypothetical protein
MGPPALHILRKDLVQSTIPTFGQTREKPPTGFDNYHRQKCGGRFASANAAEGAFNEIDQNLFHVDLL